MTDFTTVQKNLTARGFAVKAFATGAEAAAYLDGAIDGKSVGIGGSVTVRDLGLHEMLASHNEVHWHWTDGPAERTAAMGTQLLLPPELPGFLMEKCPGRDGARQLRRLVQSEVEGPLASFLLRCSRKPSRVKLRLEGGESSFCT